MINKRQHFCLLHCKGVFEVDQSRMVCLDHFIVIVMLTIKKWCVCEEMKSLEAFWCNFRYKSILRLHSYIYYLHPLFWFLTVVHLFFRR